MCTCTPVDDIEQTTAPRTDPVIFETVFPRSVALGLLALTGCTFKPGAQSELAPGEDAALDGAIDASVTDGGEDAKLDSQILPALVNTGLVGRYFIDEAASGKVPTNLEDSAPTSPEDLPIIYGASSFTEVAGNRGLSWPASGGTGKLETDLSGTKYLNAFNPATRVTIEVVVQIANAGQAGSESQIAGLRGGNPDFMLTALNATDLRFFRPFGSNGATWSNVNQQQRMVLHLVYNSNAVAEERIQLYKNGTLVPKTASSPPQPGQAVGLGGSDKLIFGNAPNQDRSIQGTIFYVAYYNAAFDANEVANNASRLIVDDDGP